MESFLVEYHLVGRSNNHICIRINMCYSVCCPRHTWSRVAMDRLCKNILFCNLRQLFFHPWQVFNIGIYKYVFLGHYLGKAVKSLLKKSTSNTKEIEELLRLTFSTARPQSASFSASKDNAITISFIDIHTYLFPVFKLFSIMPLSYIFKTTATNKQPFLLVILSF